MRRIFRYVVRIMTNLVNALRKSRLECLEVDNEFLREECLRMQAKIRDLRGELDESEEQCRDYQESNWSLRKDLREFQEWGTVDPELFQRIVGVANIICAQQKSLRQALCEAITELKVNGLQCKVYELDEEYRIACGRDMDGEMKELETLLKDKMLKGKVGVAGE